MDYRLIAFDMDGTLLSSRKEVLPSSRASIAELADAGVSVAICSGRAPIMVEAYGAELARVRYAICACGAILYDLAERRVMSRRPIDAGLVRRVAEVCRRYDVTLDAFAGGGFYYSACLLERAADYGMRDYVPMFDRLGTPADDVWAPLVAGEPTEKVDVFFADPADRDRARAELADLPLVTAYSERSSLEFSPLGVDKGVGLGELAGLLGVPMGATVAVGDADNDLPMLRAAGLAVAMGNANERARALADVVVADNDHDGCAEAARLALAGSVR
ncbi:Cof-type HAD-IIB family hydrolase [Thermophilibacter sp.]